MLTSQFDLHRGQRLTQSDSILASQIDKKRANEDAFTGPLRDSTCRMADKEPGVSVASNVFLQYFIHLITVTWSCARDLQAFIHSRTQANVFSSCMPSQFGGLSLVRSFCVMTPAVARRSSSRLIF